MRLIVFCILLSCVRFSDWVFSVSVKKTMDLLITWASLIAREPLLFILFVVFYYFIKVIKRWSLVNVVLAHSCALLSIYPLQIPLVASLHILGYLEENSKFHLWLLSFRKQIKLLEDCVQGFFGFVAALYSSNTLSAWMEPSFKIFYNSRYDQRCEKASLAPWSVCFDEGCSSVQYPWASIFYHHYATDNVLSYG